MLVKLGTLPGRTLTCIATHMAARFYLCILKYWSLDHLQSYQYFIVLIKCSQGIINSCPWCWWLPQEEGHLGVWKCYFRWVSKEVSVDEKQKRRCNGVIWFFFFVGFQRIIYLLWGKQLVSEVCGFQKWVNAQDYWKFRKGNAKEDAVRER